MRAKCKTPDKENALFTKSSKPEIAEVSLVKDNEGTLWKLQRFGNGAFVGFRIGDRYECRDIAIMVV